jgi:hypothetical protein
MNGSTGRGPPHRVARRTISILCPTGRPMPHSKLRADRLMRVPIFVVTDGTRDFLATTHLSEASGYVNARNGVLPIEAIPLTVEEREATITLPRGVRAHQRSG